jgi:hypothetical protein
VAEKNPAFEPTVQRAQELYAAARRRADRALAEWRATDREPCRLGSAEEALHQLCQAAFNADLEAVGEFVESPRGCPSTVKLPPAAFGPSAEVHRLSCCIIVPWGGYTNVRFREDAIGQIWAPSPTAPHHELKDLSIWMLDYAQREAPRKLKRVLAIKECMKQTGATWRQAAEEYQRLPMQYRYQRGAPAQSGHKSNIR